MRLPSRRYHIGLDIYITIMFTGSKRTFVVQQRYHDAAYAGLQFLTSLFPLFLGQDASIGTHDDIKRGQALFDRLGDEGDLIGELARDQTRHRRVRDTQQHGRQQSIAGDFRHGRGNLCAR
eukprot:scaffold25421_cov162-Amphora_coffeaeformis.AAC.2